MTVITALNSLTLLSFACNLQVFRGVNETSGKAVAIKCIPKYPKEEGRSQEDTAAAAEAAIMREVEIWRDLDHENIVRLQASFQTETEVCLVTELAGGRSTSF